MVKTLLGILVLGLCLASCSREGSGEAEATRLFPQLVGNLDKLQEIHIKMREAQLQIRREGDSWFIGAPYFAPVHHQRINEYLLALYDAPRGQVLAMDPEDYPRFGLTSVADAPEDAPARPVEVAFSFRGDLEDISFILGEFDLPLQQQDLAVFGQRAIARRHIRFPVEDTVVLSPNPFLFLAPAAELWEDTLFRPIKNLRSLEVTAPDGFRWEAGRESPYGPIVYGGALAGLRQSGDLVKLFNSFLSFASYAGLLPAGSGAEGLESRPHWKINARDRDGTAYRFTLGETRDPQTPSKPGDDLADSVMLFEREKPGAFYEGTLAISEADPPPSAPGSGTGRFRDRLVLFPDLDFLPVFALTDQLRLVSQPGQPK